MINKEKFNGHEFHAETFTNSLKVYKKSVAFALPLGINGKSKSYNEIMI